MKLCFIRVFSIIKYTWKCWKPIKTRRVSLHHLWSFLQSDSRKISTQRPPTISFFSNNCKPYSDLFSEISNPSKSYVPNSINGKCSKIFVQPMLQTFAGFRFDRPPRRHRRHRRSFRLSSRSLQLRNHQPGTIVFLSNWIGVLYLW